MKRILIGVLLLAGVGGCFLKRGPKTVTIGVSFGDLQSEAAIAEFEAINAELRKRELKVLGAVADGDGNKQLDQIRGFIARRITGMIVSPGRGASAPAILQAASDAGIPVVLLQQTAEAHGARTAAVLTDEAALARATVAQLAAQGLKSAPRLKAAILLGDPQAAATAARRQGFEEAVASSGGKIAIVARIDSEGSPETAQRRLQEALTAHPDLGLLFVASDSLLPAAAETLASAGRLKKIGEPGHLRREIRQQLHDRLASGEPGHLLLGSADGAPAAYRLLVDRTLDAAGSPDLFFRSESAVQATLDLLAGKTVAAPILDRGFVIAPETIPQLGSRMWGSQLRR